MLVQCFGSGDQFVGFALFGWAYLILSLIPAVGSRLPTTKALDYLDSKVPGTTPLGLAFADFDSDGQVDLLVADSSAPSAVYLNNGNGTFRLPTSTNVGSGGNPTPSVLLWSRLMGTGRSPENFVRIGHSIVALLVAYVGGGLSRRFYARGRAQPGAEAPHEPSALEPHSAR